MKFYNDEAPISNLHMPRDYPFFEKNDPEQELNRARKEPLKPPGAPDVPRYEKPEYLNDREWAVIGIRPEDMKPPEIWDGQCVKECCHDFN